MLEVSKIWIYPFKSGKGVSLPSTAFDAEGLCNDRRLVALDKNGNFLTARRFGELLQVSCSRTSVGWRLQHPEVTSICDIKQDELNTSITGVIWKDSLSALDGGDEAADWLSELLGTTARVAVWRASSRRSAKYNLETSFADAAPILLATEASAEQVCQWAGIPTDMRRYRPNIVISGAEAFAEDNWRNFRIGDQVFTTLDQCTRCILTTKDPDSGVGHPDKQPMQALKTHHSNAEGEPLFGINVVRDKKNSADNSVISVGDKVEILE